MRWLETAVFLSGVGQLVLVAGSLAIPRVLGWSQQLQAVRPLLRQVFWTYAGYILCTNASFGLVSVLAPGDLLDRSRLAACLTGFMAAWWGVRLLIQFVWFDRQDAPPGPVSRLGEKALVLLFAWLVVVYGLAWTHNMGL